MSDKTQPPGPISEAMEKLNESLKGTEINLHSGFSHKMFRGMQNEEVAQLMRQFFTGLTTKGEYIKKLESVRDMEIVQTALAVIIDDGFIKSSDTDDIFKIEYRPDSSKEKNKRSGVQSSIQKDIDKFIEKVSLSTVFTEILEDLIHYGEYHLRNVARPGEGIVELVDDIDVADILPIYRNHVPVYHLVSRSGNREGFFANQHVIKVDPKHVSSFVVSKKKIRLRVDSRWQEKRTLPEHIRMGISVIYPALGRLQQLQLTEIASKVSSLKEMVLPSVVSVGVPADTTPGDLREVTDTYENSINGMLNEAFSAMGSNPENFEEIVSGLAASGVRVLPNFSDAKGGISQIDLGISENRRLKSEGEDKVRLDIARALSIPSHYINPDERGEGRLQDLKMFSRYTRKLISIQEAVVMSLRRMIKNHFLLKDGTVIKEEDIKISFKNLVDMDLLDQSEFTMASVQVIQDFMRMVEEVRRSDIGLEFDPEVLRNVILRFLKPLNTDQELIKKVSKAKTLDAMSQNVDSYIGRQNSPAPGANGANGNGPSFDMSDLNFGDLGLGDDDEKEEKKPAPRKSAKPAPPKKVAADKDPDEEPQKDGKTDDSAEDPDEESQDGKKKPTKKNAKK